MLSTIIKTQAYYKYSIFHDFFQNIWSYSVDFFDDVFFQLLESIRHIGENLSFKVSP